MCYVVLKITRKLPRNEIKNVIYILYNARRIRKETSWFNKNSDTKYYWGRVSNLLQAENVRKRLPTDSGQ